MFRVLYILNVGILPYVDFTCSGPMCIEFSCFSPAVFTAVEKTKQSYYDIRMQLKCPTPEKTCLRDTGGNYLGHTL